MKDWTYRPARDLPLTPLQRLRSVHREVGFMGTLGTGLRWFVVRSYLRTMHGFRVIGREHLPPAPPYVLVANHSSHLDALALSAVLPFRDQHRVFPLAAGDVFFERMGTALFTSGLLNALPLARTARGGHSLQELRARLLEDGCGLILFPEGTRSRSGKMAAFKPGIGMLVAGTPVPVIPGHLRGAHAAWPPSRRFPRRSPLRLTLGPAQWFIDVPNDRAGWNAVAQRLEQAVRAIGARADL